METQPQRSALMRAAEARGLRIDWPYSQTAIDLMGFALSLANRPVAQYIADVLPDPRTRRYVEHRWPSQGFKHPEDANFIELARIGVPPGHVGFLTGIEQEIWDQDGGFFPTLQQFWGLPEQTDADLSNTIWFLRLLPFESQQQERLVQNFNSALPNWQNSLPGVPFGDLPRIERLWYPPHAHQNLPNLVIPQNSSLRFYVSLRPQENWRFIVAGRLRGWTQIASNKWATANASGSSW